ncbi:MAG TPA: M15 family metallopeptidase, partial [Chroococcidiopsis sp.]
VLVQQGLAPAHPEQLSDRQQQEIWSQVYQFWARPNLDSATPPPHSTGAAVDVTLVDAHGRVVDMGSAIDELSPRSFPNYFGPGEAGDQGDRTLTFHRDRTLLAEIMTAAGFLQHPNEWWHFSAGDQLWAWLMMQRQPKTAYIARYGRV